MRSTKKIKIFHGQTTQKNPKKANGFRDKIYPQANSDKTKRKSRIKEAKAISKKIQAALALLGFKLYLARIQCSKSSSPQTNTTKPQILQTDGIKHRNAQNIAKKAI